MQFLNEDSLSQNALSLLSKLRHELLTRYICLLIMK